MRGRRDPQATMLAFVDLDERIPQDHPIRTIKIIADEALERLSPEHQISLRSHQYVATAYSVS